MAKQMQQFEKWCDEIEYFCVDYTKRDSMRRGWKAALVWIKYKGVISDGELAGKLIDEELNGSK